MPEKKIGEQTVRFEHPPVITAGASIVGKKEGEGPLADTFDKIVNDNYFGETSWEKAERKFMEEACRMVLNKASLSSGEIDIFLAGDLLNQIISADFAARTLEIPYIGIYGACSTFVQGLALAAMMVDGGYADNVLVAASSHFSTAERQFRLPTEQGSQRFLPSQWTVTGAGAAVISRQGGGPVITHATIGKVVDIGTGDPSDMGSNMAPAAADTIAVHLKDTKRPQDYYDTVFSGDLGSLGKMLTQKLLSQKEIDLGDRYSDGGMMIYSKKQDVHAGGSGCACSAVVLCGHYLEEFRNGKIRKLFGIGTGALFNQCTSLQGETIPGIAHGVAIEIN